MKTKFYFIFMWLMIFLSSSIIICSSTDPELYIYPDPDDCAAYYECDKGVAIRMVCPTGLLFSTELQACQYPWNVDCEGRPNSEESGEKTWKEKEGICKCMDATVQGGIKYNLSGTQCVTSGNGNICTYSGLCTVANYGSCFIQSGSKGGK